MSQTNPPSPVPCPLSPLLRALAFTCGHFFLLAVLTASAQSLPLAESLWSQHRYREANDAFKAAVAAQPRNPLPRVRWGRFFLEMGNRKDAAGLFQEALQLDKNDAQAMLGMALLAADAFEPSAVRWANDALKADPKLLEAQELLARLALEDGDTKAAIGNAQKALALSPNALDALALLATIDWLDNKPSTPWINQLLARNPRYGRGYEIAGRLFILNRRYEEGIQYFRKAIAIQPDLWSARSQLGITLMRLGDDQEARAQLVQCYNAGFQDDATVNSLRLLDTYKDFVTIRSGPIVLKLHKKEADLLRPYFEPEMRRALETYDRKYHMHLDHPVQVEVYPNHEDFAVRTLGMPGLGALGVTFGYVVAMDSPTSRPPGSFHWGSTLWHELSHVYVLTATHHLVPRWFTEGLAVHEETAVSPEWGDRLSPEVILAIKNKKLLPIAELDRGFVRPEYPEQVLVSYFQAGKICDYITDHWGYDKLLAMIRDFAIPMSTPDVIRKELGLEPAEFDKRFLASVEAETKTEVANFDTWRKQLKEISELAKANKYDDVIREGKAIRDLYPEYVEAGSVYEFLAAAYTARNDKADAIAQLDRYMHVGGRNPAALKQLAALLAEAGRKPDAAAALDRLNYIEPQDADLHTRLGDLWMQTGNIAGAIREYRAVVARNPIDPAASHFNLARALRQAKRDSEARDELLLALEAAPDYRPAQKMLLELSQ